MNDILSNQTACIYIAIVIATIVTVVIEKVIPILSKKNTNVEKGIDTAKAIVDETSNIINIADSILPNNNQVVGQPLTEKVKKLKNYVFMITCSK